MLAATGCAGKPESYFHVPSFERWLEVFDFRETAFSSRQGALHAIFGAAIERGTTENGIFGLRMQRGSFDYFRKQLSLVSSEPMNDVARIETVFGSTTFVHLSREDWIDQAISLLRAEQTGLWHRNADGTELERRTHSNEPEYDAEAIARHVDDLTALDSSWESWFQSQELQPLRITYDALSRDPQDVLSSVLSEIQCDPGIAKTVATPTAKLADSESEEWKKRFVNEWKPN